MKEESLLLLSDLQKLINQVVLIDYTIIILGGDGSVDESPDCVTVYQHFHNLYGTFYRSSGTASAPQVKR